MQLTQLATITTPTVSFFGRSHWPQSGAIRANIRTHVIVFIFLENKKSITLPFSSVSKRAYFYVDIQVESGMNKGNPTDSVYVAKVAILFYTNSSTEDVSEAFQSDLVDIVHLVDD